MYAQALALLQQAVDNKSAQFRDGQWPAIAALVEKRARLLVVQRTGWGKSLVYFLASRLLRDRGAGCTILISPLLALMRNQIEAARRIGVRAETINSSNHDDWPQLEADLHGNLIDVLLISPERLANDDFVSRCLLPIAGSVGLLVVDEAHCISDWGHDFRPNYRRIVRILRSLPTNVPVLATTATANNRVVRDIVGQLGPHLEVQRGPLTRATLRLQNLALPTRAERMAWLAARLPELPGSGIVYTLTVHDTEMLARWLQSQGIDAEPYHGAQPSEQREALENRLLRNEVKALVATVALGMGFDKPDLGFVIHYQRPSSVVHYYQQVGRAGRAVDNAYGILLNGTEDDAIADYFFRTAFPSPRDVEQLLALLRAESAPLSIHALQQRVNLSRPRIEKCLEFLLLESPSPIQKTDEGYVLNPVRYQLPVDRIEAVTNLRHHELERIRTYVNHSACLMQFLAAELNDSSAAACGKCVNCAGSLLPRHIPPQLFHEARLFLDTLEFRIEPRKLWPSGMTDPGMHGKIVPDHRACQGRALCRWGDPFYGEMVRRGKLADAHFNDRLLAASARLILDRWQPDPPPAWVTCVPSSRHQTLVPDFARRLASRLGLPFAPSLLLARHTEPQKTRANSFQQACNLQGAFIVDQSAVRPEPVLLVDDMVDSRWTLTVAATLLRQAGCGLVYPFALADSSSENVE